MWDVLEHLPNPLEYLKEVYRHLVPGGCLAINTVNSSSAWANLLGLRWQLIVPPEHLYYFSRPSLEILLKAAGFSILKIGKPAKRFPLAYIFRILYSWWDKRIFLFFANYFASSFWRTVSFPINLGDNILIIAVKNV
jgi:SAM-dependent methyltransferase